MCFCQHNNFIEVMGGSTSIDKQQTEKVLENILQEEERDKIDYTDGVEVFREEPKVINGDELKQILHRSIGAITFSNKTSYFKTGTGVLISEDTVLTTAHNIYDIENKADNQEFKFYIGVDGVAKDYYQIQGWRYPEEFKTCSPFARFSNDYAIVKLKKAIKFDKYLTLSFTCPDCLIKDIQKQVKLFGFPYASANKNYNLLSPWDQEERIYKLNQYGLSFPNRIVEVDVLRSRIGYAITAYPGQDGCPVVVGNSIIAIQMGADIGKQYNVGRIIDESLVKNITEWGKQLKASSFSLEEARVCQHAKLNPLNSKQERNKKTKPIIELFISNPIMSIDLSRYSDLLYLHIFQNNIEQIDISHCPRLFNINFAKNNLQKIDISKNINLTHVCLYTNQISKIDVRPLINLIQLNLSDNQLQEIDVSANINLIYLNLSENNFSKMDVKVNTNLQKLQLAKNNLQKIDVSSNIKLTTLFLHDNNISQIDVRANVNLIFLSLSSNHFSKVDLSANIQLTYLYLDANNFQSIDLSPNINLSTLDLSSNRRLKVDLSPLINLTTLHMSENQIQHIDLSANINISQLYLSYNKIKEIDLSKNEKLQLIRLQGNILTRVCFAIPEDTNVESHSNSFELFDQKSESCRVELKCIKRKEEEKKNYDENEQKEEREPVQRKAARIADAWRQQLSQQKFNNYNCAYSFYVL